jgi:hypothetical protein
MLVRSVGSANGMGANSTASNGWRISSTHWNRAIYFKAWNVLKAMQDHNGSTSAGEMIMKKLLAIAIMAVLLCLSGLVMSGTAFADRCMDNGDGIVMDKLARQMWQKATAGPMNWDAAMSYASSLSLGGHSGWRLPSRDELANLYHSPCKSMMDVVSSLYWSSTTDAGYTVGAWLVHFYYGYVGYGNKLVRYYVRAVRAGQ